MPTQLVIAVDIGRLDATLRLSWSNKKSKDRLVAHFKEPGFEQQTKWLSLDAPCDRLAEVVQAFGSLEESDVPDAFKSALLKGSLEPDAGAINRL